MAVQASVLRDWKPGFRTVMVEIQTRMGGNLVSTGNFRRPGVVVWLRRSQNLVNGNLVSTERK